MSIIWGLVRTASPPCRQLSAPVNSIQTLSQDYCMSQVPWTWLSLIPEDSTLQLKTLPSSLRLTSCTKPEAPPDGRVALLWRYLYFTQCLCPQRLGRQASICATLGEENAREQNRQQQPWCSRGRGYRRALWEGHVGSIFATHLRLTLQWEIQPKKKVNKYFKYRVPYKGEESKSTIKQKNKQTDIERPSLERRCCLMRSRQPSKAWGSTSHSEESASAKVVCAGGLWGADKQLGTFWKLSESKFLWKNWEGGR